VLAKALVRALLLCPDAERIRGWPGPDSEQYRRKLIRTLHGSVTERTTGSVDRGALDDATPIDCIRLEMSPTANSRPASSNFWNGSATPRRPTIACAHARAVCDRFGVTENDMAQVRAWLESSGFHIEQMPADGNWIAFNATAGQIKAAFQTKFTRTKPAEKLTSPTPPRPLCPRASRAWLPPSAASTIFVSTRSAPPWCPN